MFLSNCNFTYDWSRSFSFTFSENFESPEATANIKKYITPTTIVNSTQNPIQIIVSEPFKIELLSIFLIEKIQTINLTKERRQYVSSQFKIYQFGIEYNCEK